MKSTETYYVGIDISKDNLDVFTRHDGQARSVTNDRKNIAKLITKLTNFAGNIHIVCEATGGYEKALLSTAFKANCAISLVNALCVRSYADAMGQHAKTDPIDAEMITCFAEAKKPRPTPAPTPAQEAIKALSRRRDRLVARLTQEKNSLDKEENVVVRNDIKSHIRSLERRVMKMVKEIDKIVMADDELRTKRERMESIKGVGRVFANAVLAELPELGKVTDKQASALVGVAPFPKESGRYKGKRIIRGGRSRLRRSLFMGAFAASRFNHVLSEFYQRLRAKGKVHRVAVVAVMRKLICLLNRMLADPKFQPQG